jgi:hypothetical protein
VLEFIVKLRLPRLSTTLSSSFIVKVFVLLGLGDAFVIELIYNERASAVSLGPAELL